VVGGVVGIALLTLLVWVIMRRKRKNKAEKPYLSQTETEITKYQHMASPSVHEVDGVEGMRNELTAQQKPIELSAQQKPVELPAAQGLRY
jgi:hypothetical protein